MYIMLSRSFPFYFPFYHQFGGEDSTLRPNHNASLEMFFSCQSMQTLCPQLTRCQSLPMKCESLLFHPCPVILSDIYFFCSSGFSSEIDEDYEKTRRNIVTKYDRVSFMHNINVYIIIQFKLVEFFFFEQVNDTIYCRVFFFISKVVFPLHFSVYYFFSALSGCSFS